MSDWITTIIPYIEWLNHNVTWLFSGLGVLIASQLLTMLKGSKNGSTIIQNSICVVDQGTPSIWEDFVGAYRAFNAPWKVEFHSANLSRFVSIHQKRYENKMLDTVSYLYFKDDSFFTSPNTDSWEYFQRFVKFEAMVFYGFSPSEVECENFTDELKIRLKETPLPANLEKLNVYLCVGEVPNMTFFYGEKLTCSKVKKKKCKHAIWYVASEAFYNNGIPKIILSIQNDTFWKKLHSYWCGCLDKYELLNGADIFEYYIKYNS
jgi:hypothetical protein